MRVIIRRLVFYPNVRSFDLFSDDFQQVEAMLVLNESHPSSLVEAPAVYSENLKLYIPEYNLVTILPSAPLTMVMENNDGVRKTSITACTNLALLDACDNTKECKHVTGSDLPQMVESLLTIICTCSALSLAALLANSVTHVLFPSLLNVPSN
jgi:hypothetical protein